MAAKMRNMIAHLSNDIVLSPSDVKGGTEHPPQASLQLTEAGAKAT